MGIEQRMRRVLVLSYNSSVNGPVIYSSVIAASVNGPVICTRVVTAVSTSLLSIQG